MQILGIGVDIVEKNRIKKSLTNKLFIKRIFTDSEILLAKNKKNKISFYSNRFAAKEAFSKSIGTGFRENLNFSDLSIKNDKLGKPIFVITDKIKKLIKKKFKITKFDFLLSISDEKKYSIAYVIFQKK
jgi:holo-[acyl-carrier protein] synthase|tara:strand:+ start:848 stop:1234 length:387 start_codon:yes stop_codon:yes gene_type:complete